MAFTIAVFVGLGSLAGIIIFKMEIPHRKIVKLVKPPRFGGGTFANILPRENVCQFLAKITPTTGKRPFCTQETIIYFKNT